MMDELIVEVFLGGLFAGYLGCFLTVALWDEFHVRRELKREERKAALRKKPTV